MLLVSALRGRPAPVSGESILLEYPVKRYLPIQECPTRGIIIKLLDSA